MQSLYVAPVMFEKILTGEKTMTVRRGVKDVTTGDMIIDDGEGREVKVTVTRVDITCFGLLGDIEIRLAGHATADTFHTTIRQFYADITEEDTVTCVYFALAA